MFADQGSPDRLRTYLEDVNSQAALVKLDVPTPTVQTAAEAVGTAPENIVKSLLFIAAGDPVLVIASGTQRVAEEVLSQYLEVDSDEIRLANPQEVLSETGYPVGCVPPFGHITRLRTIMDAGLFRAERVYAGGGASDRLLRTTPDEILRLSDANVIELHS